MSIAKSYKSGTSYATKGVLCTPPTLGTPPPGSKCALGLLMIFA